jgi:hypothetical protein
LVSGAVLRVIGILDGGGWGVMPAANADSVLLAIEAGEFVARSASGTITVLATQPVTLRLDVMATDSAGASVRVKGDARFGSRRERRPCSALADEADGASGQ